ncbi:MAG: hypothetical protein P8019_12475 [Gammaproteobacteria bacterium]
MTPTRMQTITMKIRCAHCRMLSHSPFSTNTAHDHEDTDWVAVARFTRQCLERLTQTV